MKIINLNKDSKLYTSNVLLVLGSWNTIDDMTTLIDVGSDNEIIKKIENINTGLGKKKVDQVIITHSHSDHTAILLNVKEAFQPKVYAFNAYLNGIDHIVKDGDFIRIGEHPFEVIQSSIHSSDSICLFCKAEGLLFVGDTPIPNDFDLLNTTNKYPERLIQNWNYVHTIYFGHGSCKTKD